jgi:hypothetical protein
VCRSGLFEYENLKGSDGIEEIVRHLSPPANKILHDPITVLKLMKGT